MNEGSVAGRLGIRPGDRAVVLADRMAPAARAAAARRHDDGRGRGRHGRRALRLERRSVQWFLRRYGTVITLPPAVWICSPTVDSADLNRAYLAQILAGHGLQPVEELQIDAVVDGRAHRSDRVLTVAAITGRRA